MKTTFDLVVVGHQTIDEIYLPGRSMRRSPGGPATFSSLAVRRLGRNVAVISRVGEDFPDDYVYWLSRRGVNLDSLLRDAQSKTTRFKIRYGEGCRERELRLVSRCSDISPQDISEGLSSEAVHLGPVAGEIPFETARRVREISELLSIDLQGCIRKFDSRGNMILTKEFDRRIIELTDVVKISQDEVRTAFSTENIRDVRERLNLVEEQMLTITRGSAGSLILWKDRVTEVPSYPPERIEDPTGAGDAFIGVFVSELAKGNNLKDAAAIGSAAASFVIEGEGPSSFGTEKEILRRAETILREM